MARAKASATGNASAGTRSSRRLRASEEPNRSPLQQLPTPKRNTRSRATKPSATGSAPSRVNKKPATRATRSSRQPSPEQTPEENVENQETNSEEIQNLDNQDNQEIDNNDIEDIDANEAIPTIEPSPPSSPLANLDSQSPPSTQDQLSPSPTIIEADAESDSPNYIRKTIEIEHVVKIEEYIANIEDSNLDPNTNASPTPAVAAFLSNSSAQVRSACRAISAAHEVESIGVQTSPSLYQEPYRGSFADRRRERERQVIARCESIEKVKIIIPRTHMLVELAHFDDPIVNFTSSDLKSSSAIRTALCTLAFKLTEIEKVDKLIKQRTKIAELEESNAEKLAAKDAEIDKLKKQLKKVARKSGEKMTPSPEKLNGNGKRPTPADESIDGTSAAERSSRALKMQKTATGALEVVPSDDPTVDNALRRLLFNQPAPQMPTIDEDEEPQEQHTQETNLILWSVDQAIKTAPSDNFYRRRMMAFERAKRRQKRIENGEGDYESDHECEHSYVLPEKTFEELWPGLKPFPKSADDNNDNDNDDNNTQSDEESEIQESAQEHDQLENRLNQANNAVEADSEPQADLTVAPVTPEPPPQTPSRWGLRSLLGSVSRLVGRSPRTEPPRQPATEPRQERRSAVPNTPTAPNNTAAHKRRTSGPTTPATGITSNHFTPQTAPQMRNTVQSARMKKTRAERMASYLAGQERVKKEAAAAKQAAEAAEEKRLQAEAEEREQQIGQKRKRVRIDDLEAIPAGPPGTFSLIDKYFVQNSDDEDDYVELDDQDVSMLDVFTPAPSPSPAKKVRFNDSPARDTSSRSKMASPMKSSMTTPTRRTIVGDPHRAQPYLGTMFLTPSERAERAECDQGTNIFDQSSNTSQTESETTSISMDQLETYAEIGRRTGYWVGPKIVRPSGPYSNPEGTFIVPDDSDTESEFDSENENTLTTPEKSEEEKKAQLERDVADFGNIFTQHKKQRSQESTALTETTGNSQKDPLPSLQPPPTPTPAHASLPAGPAANAQSDSEALARVRSQAEKYKPKTPSGLRAASRVASSPIGPDSSPTPSGRVLSTTSIENNPVASVVGTNANENAPVVSNHNEDDEDEFSHQWVWPAPRVPDIPPMDAQTSAALDAFLASPEGIEYVNNYHKKWCPPEYWYLAEA